MGKLLDLVFFLIFLPISAAFWLFLSLFFWPSFLLGRRIFQNLADLVYKETISYQRKKIIERVAKGSRVLDVGAGSCYLAKAIAQKRKARVACADVANFNKTNLPLILFDGISLPFKDKRFDFVILSYVLHHTQTQEKLLKECARVCRGEILVLEDEPVFQKNLFARAHERIYNFLYNLNGEVTYYSPQEWKKIFKRCGLEVKKEDSRWGIGAVVAPMKRMMFVLKPS